MAKIETSLMKVTELVPGDRIDLEGDPYADPKGGTFHGLHESMYGFVESVEQETKGCVRVDFQDSPSVGFPAEHELKVLDRREHLQDLEEHLDLYDEANPMHQKLSKAIDAVRV